MSRDTQEPAQRASAVSSTGFSPSLTVRSRSFDYRAGCSLAGLAAQQVLQPHCASTGFGLIRVRSPLLTESLLFSLPGGTEMVHFPPLPSRAYVFSSGFSGISQRGFPHSEIPGSKLVCSSPRLIAAYRVLHRLPAPRHSPCALSSLTV